MSARKGYQGLTNRACEKWDDKAECSSWVVQEYKLDDPKTRELLRKLMFVCNVNGKHYRICEDKAALCRNTFHWCGTFRTQRCKDTEVMDWDAEFHQAAGTKCASQESYPFEELK